MASRMAVWSTPARAAAAGTVSPVWWDIAWFMCTNVRVRSRKFKSIGQKSLRVAYFLSPKRHYRFMTTLCARDTVRVNETAWERLYRLIELRRAQLDLTLSGLQVVGGPSPKWVQKLRSLTGPPSSRMRASLLDLDRALQWEPGTSWGLVEHDRSGWSDALLEDEEQSLLNVGPDEADNFGYIVAARLRAIPAGPERDAVMRKILEVLEVHR